MGNSQSTLPEGVTIKSDEKAVNFQLLSDNLYKEPTDVEIESSQLDHFSPEKRVEELKSILGEQSVKTQRDFFAKTKTAFEDCLTNVAYAKSKQLEGYGVTFVPCFLRKTESVAKLRGEFKCVKDAYIDEMLDIDSLLKLPKEIVEEKLDNFANDYEACLFNENSNENIRFFEAVSFPTLIKEQYSGILATPIEVQVLKSRYLPNKTLFEKKEIESELMEPFMYDPKSDSEQDLERKLMALAQTDFLKHDIKIVKECYHSSDPKIKRDCFMKYLEVFNIAELVLCKRELLKKSPRLRFPNIEDAGALEFNQDDFEHLMKNGEVMFPNMPEFYLWKTLLGSCSENIKELYPFKFYFNNYQFNQISSNNYKTKM